jgi:anthranilate synthase component 1
LGKNTQVIYQGQGACSELEEIRVDAFQIVLSQRFDLDLDAEPFDLYRGLRQVNPSPYMYFVRQPGLTLVGASPEPLVRLTDGKVISRPIAGTRRRGRTDEDDARLGAELREHPKEVAEHVMLVDLARNDVGRVVRFGTEQVDEYLTLERYSHVMHLTSQVSGELAEGRTSIDVLRATLPAGTQEVRSWLRRPAGSLAGVWFVRSTHPRGSRRRAGGAHRVRRPRNHQSGAGEADSST